MENKIVIESLEITDDTVIWKYLNISKFISLISKKSLWLARADTLKDKYEGMFPPEMRQILDTIYQEFETKDETKDSPIKDASDFQQYLIKNAYIDCWHQNLTENMVMWEIYGQTENSIAIKTTVKELIDSLKREDIKKHKYKFAFEPVTYKKPEDVQGKLTYETPFLIKRPHFSFEKEVRLFLSTYSFLNPNINTPIGHEISIDLSTIIKEIYIHPDADEWFLEAVQALVDQFKLSVIVKRGLCGNKF